MAWQRAIAVSVVMLSGQCALADSIDFRSAVRRVTALEASDGAPAGGVVYEHYVTTDADIVSIGLVETNIISGQLYDHPLSSAGESPRTSLQESFPGLSADSFITTPGPTQVSNIGSPMDGDTTFRDTEDNGPQTDFRFAQLTFPNGGGVSFSGQVSIEGSAGVFAQPFSFLNLPIVQHAYLDSYPADGSEIPLTHALARNESVVSNAIVLSAAGPGGLPFEIHDVTVNSDEHGLFSATANGMNIDVEVDLAAAGQMPSGRRSTAELTVETNSGDLNFTLSVQVPEPATWVFAAIGVLSCGVKRPRFAPKSRQ